MRLSQQDLYEVAQRSIKDTIAYLNMLRRHETASVRRLLNPNRKKPLDSNTCYMVEMAHAAHDVHLQLAIQALELIQDIRSGARHPESVYLPLTMEKQEREKGEG